MKSPYFSDYFWEKISWLTKSSRFHGCLKLGLLCPITELLWELGTNVVVTSPKEDICRELMSKRPRSEKGKIILSERDAKTTKIQRNMSLSDSSSERSFNSEDSEAIWRKWKMNKVIASRKFHVKAWKMTLHMPMNPWLMKNGSWKK